MRWVFTIGELKKTRGRYVPNLENRFVVKLRAGEWNVERIFFTLWTVSQRGMNEPLLPKD